jgi:hypothetical protein
LHACILLLPDTILSTTLRANEPQKREPVSENVYIYRHL